jgi:hypothetical protein
VIGKSNIHFPDMLDLGTTSPILGKPKFVTLADEISFNDIGCMLQLAVDNVDQPYLLVFL